MDIERINENTVKFYISYVDIENRGFQREEIWYNRERSEQLFWQMMEEVNDKEEDFSVDGPLWIQVQALEKGLEIIVTKAQISKNDDDLDYPTENEKRIDISIHDKVESLLNEKLSKNEDDDLPSEEDDSFWLIVCFKEFEDVIQLSHYLSDITDCMKNVLYAYKNKYYLYLEFADEIVHDARKEDIISRVFEFGEDSEITLHVLEEYGTKVFADNTFAQVRKHFSV